jgi:predicted  nucleic acid-binding Zn-ribbon protein
MELKKDSGFSCQECGHKFKTIKAAEKASFGDSGCPKCGGSDIDLHRETQASNRDYDAARRQQSFGE